MGSFLDKQGTGNYLGNMMKVVVLATYKKDKFQLENDKYCFMVNVFYVSVGVNILNVRAFFIDLTSCYPL